MFENLQLSWPNTPLEWALYSSVALAAAWTVMSALVWLRRRATNLTPVSAARVNEQAQPDFLQVNQAERQAALDRGDAYDAQLRERETAANQTDEAAQLGWWQQLVGAAALVTSIVSIVGLGVGCFWRVKTMEPVVREYLIEGKISEFIAEHPVALSVAFTVVAINVVLFVAKRRRA